MTERQIKITLTEHDLTTVLEGLQLRKWSFEEKAENADKLKKILYNASVERVQNLINKLIEQRGAEK